METKFQTSFIPKKPLPSIGTQGVNVGVPVKLKPVHSTSLFFTFALIIFLLSAGAAGGAYAWKTILIKNQDTYKKDLADKKKQFNPELIRQLKAISIRIDDAKIILVKHIAASTIFDALSRLTAENIRFLNLEISTPQYQDVQKSNPNSKSSIDLSISGYGVNLTTVAFQAKVLSQLEKYNLTNMIMNPVISEPTIELNGTVSFKMSGQIDPSRVLYSTGFANTEEVQTGQPNQ